MYQIYELFEQFFFPVTAIDLLFRKVTLNLVVGVEKENLQQVLCNGFAIQIFRIAVDGIVIDTSTGTVSLRAVFPNKEGLLTSGGSGNVIIPVRKENCIVVPQSATYEVQDKVYVYKVVDGKAQSVPVQVTRVNGGQEYIVESGLKVGDTIVAEGVGLLREGTSVQPKTNE